MSATFTVNPNPQPAGTIAAPVDFDPQSPGAIFEQLPVDGVDIPAVVQASQHIVAPYVKQEELVGRSRHIVQVVQYVYAVALPDEAVPVATHHRASLQSIDVVLTTTINTSMQALPVTVSGSLYIAVPAVFLSIVAWDQITVGDVGDLRVPISVLAVQAYPPVFDSPLVFSFDGANGSSTTTSKPPYLITPTTHGPFTLSSAQKRFGATSAFFPGPTGPLGAWLTYQSPEPFGLADFCIEFWIYITADANGYGSPYAFGDLHSIDIDFDRGRLALYLNNVPNTLLIMSGLMPETWHHVGLMRTQHEFRLFKDGVVSGYKSAVVDIQDVNHVIGDWDGGGDYSLPGVYMDDLRVTIGNSVYDPAGYTPPGSPF